ncbi:MAG: hypothetical protein LBJ31_05865 [Treponema sp.]|jgi:uncharacterized integral membrane protein|nr:hypothetical protein [Treponema sp.]
MPWRMLGLILVLAVLLVFIGSNLDNRCDLSIGFVKFESVPIYFTVFASFMLGMLCSLPFIIFKSFKKAKKPAFEPNEAPPDIPK